MRPADASSKTVRLYGETMQRCHGGFVGRSRPGSFSIHLMRTYVIGDLQGCAHEAGLLLDQIAGDAGADTDAARILFVGDLINRGPQSLAALRRMKALSEASDGRIEALLGNHDLHLLAVAAGVRKASR